MPPDDKVVPLFPGKNGEVATPLSMDTELSADALLTCAQGKLDEIVILGVDRDGGPYIATSHGVVRALALIELCKAEIADMMRIERGWLIEDDS